MFLNALEKQNPALMEAALRLWQRGEIRPDSYVIDVDQVLENARLLKATAEQHDLKLYLMSKQFGRNPLLCRLILQQGFHGIVAVDFKEAQRLWQHGLPVAHVGHLVQLPEQLIDFAVAQRPEVITVYSLEKAESIGAAARRHNCVQPLLLKVVDQGDVVYPNQEAGFTLAELPAVLAHLQAISGIAIVGITHFPCMAFCEKAQQTRPTHNLHTLLAAKTLLQQHGIDVQQVNAPSASSVATLPLLAAQGVTHAEPGHALTGTLPANQHGDGAEKIAMLYLSEISHNQHDTSYCYGGGHYRRSHMQHAAVWHQGWQHCAVQPIDSDSIDYTLPLAGHWPIGSAVVMCFRSQVFVTRSDVALIGGISSGKPTLLGLFDSLGNALQGATYG
ncbi:YhfX family PLP-dependent enzyme [Pantoea agglomerans]